MKTETTIKLLRDWVKQMEEVKEKQLPFDMNDWCKEAEDGRPACGSAACAAGWASCIPSWQERGYRLSCLGCPMTPNTNDPFVAVFATCGIDFEECFWVCDPCKYAHPDHVTIGHVTRRIKALIRRYEKKAGSK